MNQGDNWSFRLLRTRDLKPTGQKESKDRYFDD
jgi:hypothetical protein